MKRSFVSAASAALLVGAGASGAFAGEVKGPPNQPNNTNETGARITRTRPAPPAGRMTSTRKTPDRPRPRFRPPRTLGSTTSSSRGNVGKLGSLPQAERGKCHTPNDWYRHRQLVPAFGRGQLPLELNLGLPDALSYTPPCVPLQWPPVPPIQSLGRIAELAQTLAPLLAAPPRLSSAPRPSSKRPAR